MSCQRNIIVRQRRKMLDDGRKLDSLKRMYTLRRFRLGRSIAYGTKLT